MREDKDKYGLTFNERQFADLYRASSPRNATEAYLQVFPDVKYVTARSNAHRVLKRPHVRKYVKRLDEKFHMAAKINAERVLNEIARGAFRDLRKLYDKKDNLKPIHKLDDDTAAVVSEISYDAQGNKKVKVVSKADCLKMLAQYLKLITNVHEVNTMPDINVNITKNPEKYLKDRNIPLPKLDCEDIKKKGKK